MDEQNDTISNPGVKRGVPISSAQWQLWYQKVFRCLMIVGSGSLIQHIDERSKI